MTVSRWKVMAGVLGVSLGGLAAIAGPCPKPGETHRVAESPPAKADAPKVPPAGPSVPPPVELPSPGPSAELPPLPTPAKSEAPKLPDLAPPQLGPMPTKPDVPPASPTVIPTSPASEGPALPPIPGTPAANPAPASPPSVSPAVQVEAFGQVPSPPNPTTTPLPPGAAIENPTPPAPEPAVRPAAAVVAAPAAAKFRIILRVGEGEPTFEVRTGDDLMMKVVCEKVDVKSPEKGQGPSAVRATGKVRFVGFGAEGTCDELSFLAGTGEVMMAGRVKVQVKDKLGRVESEIASDKLNYKLDSGSIPVGIKP
jgi:hypothetical protein